MYTGRIVAFFERKEITLGLCVEERAGGVTVLFGAGCRMRLGIARIVLVSDDVYDTALPQESLIGMVAARTHVQTALQAQVSVADLWRSLDGTVREFSLPDLARVIFGSEARFDHACAVLRAIACDNLYFKLHGAMVHARPVAEVEARRLQAEREHARFATIAQGAAWLRSALSGEHTGCAGGEAYLEILKSIAIFGKQSPLYADYREMLEQAGISDQRQCFEALVRLGVWDPDENILPSRYGVPSVWPTEVVETCETVTTENLRRALNDPARVDLTGLRIFSIDDPATRDIDDALSIELTPDGAVLGVHIADAAALVPAGSALDRAAAERGTTVYFPDGKIPLLPPVLSEGAASLQEGVARPAMSFFITLSSNGEIRGMRGLPSVVRVAKRLSYAEADDAVAEGGAWNRLYELACGLRRSRMATGAVVLTYPELFLRVDATKKIFARLRDRETPSQVLVSECMIAANYCAALRFRDSGCPAVFRRQAAPANRPDPSARLSLFELYRLRRQLNRVSLGVAPGPHGTLGLLCYATITSPIRKYADMVNQRQLSCLLRGQPPCYTRKALHDLIAAVQPVLARAALIEQERKRYWILKLLQTRIGAVMDAIVLGRTRHGFSLLLADLLYEAELRTERGKSLAPGAHVSAIIERVDPYDGTLAVGLAAVHPDGA